MSRHALLPPDVAPGLYVPVPVLYGDVDTGLTHIGAVTAHGRRVVFRDADGCALFFSLQNTDRLVNALLRKAKLASYFPHATASGRVSSRRRVIR